MFHRMLSCLGLFAVLTANCSAQVQTRPSVDNLYSRALRASILEMEKQWGRIDDSLGGQRTRTDFRRIIVEKDAIITDGLPTTFEDHAVAFLDDDELISRFQILKKSFSVLKVRPIQNAGAVLRIAVVVYWFSRKGRKVEFALSDWSDVEFRYDCAAKSFAISSIKLGGI